jgi:tetratricopeptide (TPR) repeat protein
MSKIHNNKSKGKQNYKRKKVNKTVKKKIKLNNFPIHIPQDELQITLFPKIYNISKDTFFPVSKNKEAQKYINNAMTLLYAFNQEEACNNFIMAFLYDNTCAFALWGASYSIQLNVNHIIITENVLKFAIGCLQKALQICKNKKINTPEIIIDLVNALYYRVIIKGERITSHKNYNPSYKDIESNLKRYNKEMKKLYKKYNTDNDIAVLYAASIMTIHPWKWWKQGSIYLTDNVKTPVVNNELNNVDNGLTQSAINVLQNVLTRNSNHIGALHYFIHAVEESPYPIMGLGPANILDNMNTEMGHLIHMPSHIYSRLGLYEKSIQSNIKAVDIDMAFIKYKNKKLNKYKNNNPTSFIHIHSFYIIEYVAHNMHFIIIDALRMGNFTICLEYLQKLENHVNMFIDMKTKKNTFLEHFLTLRSQIYLRFGKYNELLQLERPNSLYCLWNADDSFCRVIALCKLNKKNEAYNEYKNFVLLNNTFISQAPKEQCRCGCQKRHGGISNPHYGMNKYTYFNENGITYKNNSNVGNVGNVGNVDKLKKQILKGCPDINIRSCCVKKCGNQPDKYPRYGGITSPHGNKLDDKATTPEMSGITTGTLTINNTEMLANIRQELANGFIKWHFESKEKSLLNCKNATIYFESLEYDEPSDFFYVVHETYSSTLYQMEKYEEAYNVSVRGNIPYPNNIRLIYIQMLCLKNMGETYNHQYLSKKKEYNDLQKLTDTTITLNDL